MFSQATFEAKNEVIEVGSTDEIYSFDEDQQRGILQQKPWDRDVEYFKSVKMSAIALLKIVMHSRSGGNKEVMGMMQGKIDGSCMIVLDSFALPVEGTETRVNAHAEAYEYMTTFTESCKSVGKMENVVGWYHSHPGYGCWLSGIDVNTQMVNQTYQEPFLAVVIDPVRTISSGKVNIGAFRTYPKGYQPPDEPTSQYQTIPLSKIEDFGVHCKQYYPLEIAFFKSSLDGRIIDSLWNKYWINTLSANQLHTNAEYLTGQIGDLAEKVKQVGSSLERKITFHAIESSDKKVEEKLSKISRDSVKLSVEVQSGLVSHVLKRRLFTLSDVELSK